MSSVKLSNVVKKRVIAILKTNLRDELNLSIPELELDRDTTVTQLIDDYNMTEKEARSAFAFILSDLRGRRIFTRVTGVPGKAAIFSPTLSKAKNKYDAVSSWKRSVSKKLEKKFGIADFSKKFHLGHGGEGSSSVPAVGYRAIKAAKYLAGREGGEAMLGVLMSSKLIKGFAVDGDIDTVLTKRGDFKKKYKVWIKLDSGADNLSEAVREKALNKALIDELTRIAVMEDTSKSSITAIGDFVEDALTDHKDAKGLRQQSKSRVTYKNPKYKRTKVQKGRKKRLRTSGGQFTSPMNIQAVLDQRIKQQVQENMGEGGALVNRTGRFAQSVSVEKVMQSRQGTLTAFYTYMKAPYQTFERGYAQGSARRDPRKIISRSIREIAAETLNHKLGIRTRRV